MKRIFILIFVALFFASMQSNAQFGKNFQEEQKSQFQKRMFLGGGIGFWIWPREGYVYVSPMLGYHLSPSFDVGTRVIYSYYWYNYNGLKFDEHDYGAGVFARYYLFFFKDLFIHAEYEFLSHEEPVNLIYYPSPRDEWEYDMNRVPLHNIYVGGGYRQWISNSAFVSILILFNLNETEYAPNNPIIRIGFGVGL